MYKKSTYKGLYAFKLFGFFLLLMLFNCKKDVKTVTEVYNNTFETEDLTGITGGAIDKFNNTKVLGRYNNGSFSLLVNNLPKHDLIAVSFDLYINDSWDGNEVSGGIDGPDIWEMLLDNSTYINTTFSNSYCAPGTLCSPQSYPNDYPNNNHNPKSGATISNLPGACSKISDQGGSSLYRITKTISHTNSTFLLQCLDHLVQTNALDKKCDESWSVDNIKIEAITL